MRSLESAVAVMHVALSWICDVTNEEDAKWAVKKHFWGGQRGRLRAGKDLLIPFLCISCQLLIPLTIAPFLSIASHDRVHFNRASHVNAISWDWLQIELINKVYHVMRANSSNTLTSFNYAGIWSLKKSGGEPLMSPDESWGKKDMMTPDVERVIAGCDGSLSWKVKKLEQVCYLTSLPWSYVERNYADEIGCYGT